MRPLRAVLALLKGETSSRPLEAYRRRGARIYDLLNQQPRGLWEEPPGAGAGRLCAWNAFALQLFADRLQEADSKLDPYTEGFTPAHLHGLLLRYYQTSIQWYEAALEAQQDLTYLPPAKLPASMPAWKGASQFSHSILTALYEAVLALREQSDKQVDAFAEVSGGTHSRANKGGAERGVQVFTFPENHPEMLRVLLHKQSHAGRKLIAVGGQLARSEVGRNTWFDLRLAAGQYFALGQLAAMPELIKTP
ncbi:MAG: hypothetical protein SFU83_11485 [Meiothermus sp.]|nr:hypothetical protein [Meiothermus sp.]